MKYIDYREGAFINDNKRQLVRENLLECYQKLQKENTISGINNIIRSHRRFINHMELKGKKINKYKTVTYLETYKNSRNRIGAMSVLTNTINNMQGISLY